MTHNNISSPTAGSFSSFRWRAVAALLLMLLGGAKTVSAAVIGSAPPTVSGPVGLLDIAPVLTNAINNDNDSSPFNPANRLELLELQFLGVAPIDVVFPITNSGGVTEYGLGLGTTLGFISTSIINSSGAAWSGMQVRLGTGTGGAFTPASLSSGHDFDIPHGDPLPASDVFLYFSNGRNKLNFIGGTVPSAPPEDSASHFIMTANMDLPDGLGSNFTLRLTPLLLTEIGETQDNPIVPEVVSPGVFLISGATRRKWFDPPTAYGFEYTMQSQGELFTEIVDFPTGFLDEFEVTVGSTSLGFFGPGDSLIFPNGGVPSFRITGINPQFDPINPIAFPIQLDFTDDDVTFSMTALEAQAVPEPSSLALLGLGLLAVACGTWRQRSRAK